MPGEFKDNESLPFLKGQLKKRGVFTAIARAMHA
jgi:hypothetical protein